jgi:hypothetical protein
MLKHGNHSFHVFLEWQVQVKSDQRPHTSKVLLQHSGHHCRQAPLQAL